MDESPSISGLDAASSGWRHQYLALGVWSLVLIGFTIILNLSIPTAFRPYFGGLNPILAMVIVTILGGASLAFLLTRGWFVIYQRKKNWKSLIVFAAIATLLAWVMILVDIAIVFPPDINVLPPQSLLFYSVMGYVAETAFHLIPLSLTLFIGSKAFGKRNWEKVVWTFMLLIALIEPIFQLALTSESWEHPLWADVYLGFHLFAFNSIQLYLLKRYDFVSMFAFRLVYYLNWHIVWGYLRLDLLF